MDINEHSDLIDATILLLSWKLIDRKEHNKIVSSINEIYKYCKIDKG